MMHEFFKTGKNIQRGGDYLMKSIQSIRIKQPH